jgi:hypothetical protein
MSDTSVSSPPPDTRLSSASKAEIRQYTCGECHIFALALHRKFGWRIHLVLDNDEPYWIDDSDIHNFIPAVVHAYALDENDMAWDVCGRRTLSHVHAEANEKWHIGDYDSTQIHSEEELKHYVGCWKGNFDEDEIDRPLAEYNDEDVRSAELVAMRVLSAIDGFYPCMPGENPLA